MEGALCTGYAAPQVTSVIPFEELGAEMPF
jgi:hypothetical protein